MCTIQENDNINLVIEVAGDAVENLGAQRFANDAILGTHSLSFDVLQGNKTELAYNIARAEAALDILKHHYNITREVTAAKTNHLNALKTLIK